MSKMKMYRTSKWFAAFVAVSCAAIGLLQFGFAEADPEGTEATTSTAGSGELRQRAKVLRPNDHGVGRLVADITFADLEGKQRSLAEFKSRKLVVFAMTSTSCPLSRKYLPTLTTLAQSYSAKGVQFITVNCVPTDKTEEMKVAAAAFGKTAVYVHDLDEELARQLGAMTTTDVIVLDPARTVVYHGAIDDQYGIGYALDAPRHTFLATALDSLLAGKTPEVPATVAPGCLLDHEPTIVVVADATYHNRISRIMQQNCIECHRTGGVGPFALDTYADVVAHAPMIRDVIERGAMPPWFAAKPEAGHKSIWANDRSLADADRNDLTSWIQGKRTEGNSSDAPIPRKFADEWSIGQPDYVVQIPNPIDIKATGTMPYQFVKTETMLDEDKWVQGYEIAPTDRSVVHHVIVNVHEADPDLNIPPHTANHVETITRPVSTDISVMAYMAHMHVRGKSFNFELTTPDGKTETLLDIPRYDFNWQLRYDYLEPRVIPKGSRVKVTAVFDNSENNPANPDPTKTVHWGRQTYEEMLIGYVETFAPVGEQRPTRGSRPGGGAALFKVLDTDGDEMLSRDEARKAIDRVPKLKDNPAVLELLFSRIDQDGDGKLNIEEFEKLRQDLGGRRP